MMNTSTCTDIFAAKDLVNGVLREMRQAPYSRLLMTTLLPEQVLGRVLDILQKERKIALKTSAREADEAVYLPMSPGRRRLGALILRIVGRNQ